MSDLTETTVNTQPDPSLTTDSTGTGTASGSVETTSDQSTQNDIGNEELGKTLSPELEKTRKELLRDYHEKLSKTKEDRLRFESELNQARGNSETLTKLMQQEWFKKAMDTERARRNGSIEDLPLTDEDFETAKTDKRAFLKLVSNVAERIASGKMSQVEPALGTHQERLENMEIEKEFDSVDRTYKDFKSLNDAGSLDPFLERGLSFEDAYLAYKGKNPSNIDKLAADKAREMLDLTRAGAVGKTGSVQINGKRVLEASNFDDAFDQTWAALQRGEKDVVVNRKK